MATAADRLDNRWATPTSGGLEAGIRPGELRDVLWPLGHQNDIPCPSFRIAGGGAMSRRCFRPGFAALCGLWYRSSSPGPPCSYCRGIASCAGPICTVATLDHHVELLVLSSLCLARAAWTRTLYSRPRASQWPRGVGLGSRNRRWRGRAPGACCPGTRRPCCRARSGGFPCRSDLRHLGGGNVRHRRPKPTITSEQNQLVTPRLAGDWPALAGSSPPSTTINGGEDPASAGPIPLLDHRGVTSWFCSDVTVGFGRRCRTSPPPRWRRSKRQGKPPERARQQGRRVPGQQAPGARPRQRRLRLPRPTPLGHWLARGRE